MTVHTSISALKHPWGRHIKCKLNLLKSSVGRFVSQLVNNVCREFDLDDRVFIGNYASKEKLGTWNRTQKN